PVKFGQRAIWPAVGGATTLATYQIPEDAAYLVILKTECYAFTNVSTEPGFRNFEPPPTGNAQWVINTTAGFLAITGLLPIHLLVEASEFLLIKAGLLINLQGTLDTSPHGNNGLIRTTV